MRDLWRRVIEQLATGSCLELRPKQTEVVQGIFRKVHANGWLQDEYIQQLYSEGLLYSTQECMANCAAGGHSGGQGYIHPENLTYVRRAL